MKKAVTQKMLSFFLAFCVIFTLVPMNAFAASANDIVRIAAGEVGTNGRPNKYTYWQGSIGGSYSYAWCACFVGWCANQAGESAAIPKTASVYYLANGILNAGGQRVSYPQAGDIVVYRRRSDNYYAHVGIMENGSTSIEGNYSNGVHCGINPYRYSYGGASVANGGIELIFLRPNYKNSNANTAPTVEYFNCNVQISTTAGKTVRLYSNPTDSNQKTVFTRGQSAQSTRGAKLSDGSTWYQIQVNHQGQVISVWLNAASDGVTVTDLRPSDTYSMDISTELLTVSPRESQAISINYRWTGTAPYNIGFRFDSDNIATAAWGEQSGQSVKLVVTGQNAGTATLSIWLSSKEGRDLCRKIVTVNVASANQPLNLGSEFTAFIYNPGLQRYVTNDSGSEGAVTSRSYNSAQPKSQLWKFTRLTDGSYQIISQLNGYDSLDVQEFGTSSGTNVRAYPWNGCSAQRWYILGTGEPGRYVLTAACTKCVLDVNGNSSAEGENVQMYEYNRTGAQVFEIRFVQ